MNPPKRITVQFPRFGLCDPSLLACVLFHCPSRRIKTARLTELSRMKVRLFFYLLSILLVHLHFLIFQHLVRQHDCVVKLHLTSQGLQGLQVFTQRLLRYGCSVHPDLIGPVQASATLLKDSRPCRNFACLQLLAS